MYFTILYSTNMYLSIIFIFFVEFSPQQLKNTMKNIHFSAQLHSQTLHENGKQLLDTHIFL